MDFPKNPVKEVSPHGIITPEAESYGNGTRRIPQFRKVSLKRSIPLFGAIILGNCVTLGLFAILLRVYQKKPELEKGDKHAFNAMALLLSGILTLGIGFLVDSLALIGRGYVLVGRPHSLRAVAYVVRGTLSSQLKFAREKLFRRHFDLSGSLVIGFILFGIFGRLGIAFLGLAFNVDDRIQHTPSLEVTPWPDTRYDWDETSLVESKVVKYSLPELGAFAKAGLISDQIHLPNPKDSSSDFGASVLMKYTGADLFPTIGVDSVTYRYEVVNFQDNHYPVASSPKREVVSKAECKQVKILSKDGTSFRYQEDGKNKTFPYHKNEYLGFVSAFDLTATPELGWVRYIYSPTSSPNCGVNCSQLWVWKMPDNNTTKDLGLLFQCNHTLTPPQDPKETSPDPKYSLNFSESFTSWLPVVVGNLYPAGGYDDPKDYENVDYYGDYDSLMAFDHATAEFMDKAMESPQANLWVAASISRYTTILARQLNRVVMPKLSLRKANDRPISRLKVTWPTVGGLLGGIVGFQILLTALVLYFSHGSILVEDDVSTLGHFFTPLLNFEQVEESSSKVLLRQVPVDAEMGKRYSIMIEEVPENQTR